MTKLEELEYIHTRKTSDLIVFSLRAGGHIGGAFYSVAQAARKHGVSAERALAIAEELAVYAGARGMVGGQAADMLGEQGITKLEELEYIHTRKTSDLIVFSLRAGGHIGGAFYSVAQAARKHGVSAERALAIAEELAVYAGARGMVGGQAADMLGEQGITKLEELEYIHTRKTSDLIVFSLRAGGHIGGADAAQLSALETFGRGIGLAFQIQDDILDLTGDEALLGKPLRSDEKQHKVTYPYFIGLEASRAKVEELTGSAKRAIRESSFPNAQRLLQLADFMMKRDH
ncbi:polyprenyl synthetase family protein [Gordoniibacillus kamchatkensis]